MGLWAVASGVLVVLGLLYLRYRWLGMRARLISSWTPESGRSGLWEKDGVRIRYHISGKGPTLVCLHGMGASSASFRALVPLLDQYYEVLLVDLPGFGESHWPIGRPMTLDALTEVLCQFLKDHVSAPSYICGSSLGGALAMELGARQPEVYKKILVLAPASRRLRIPPVAWLSRVGWLFQWLVHPEMVVVAMMWARSRTWPSREERDLYVRPYLVNPSSFYSLIAVMEVLRDARLPSRFAGLSSPVLVLWGARDRVVRLTQMQSLMKVLPQARFAQDSKSGHHPHEDNPTWTAAQILEFLSEN